MSANTTNLTLLTDPPSAYSSFIRFTQNPELPFIDVEATLSMLIEAMVRISVAEETVKEVVNLCAYEDLLFSHTDEHFTMQLRDDLFHELFIMAKSLHDQLRDLGAYDNNGILCLSLRSISRTSVFEYINTERTFDARRYSLGSRWGSTPSPSRDRFWDLPVPSF